MSIGTASFLVIVLFVVHEFEEIIRIYPWINRHINDPKFSRDIWISRRESYPSTESIATMIAEEIIIAGIILTAAIVFHVMPVVIAIVIINSVHLIGHIIFAIRVRAWNPGSITSVITLPLNIIVIVLTIIKGINLSWLLIATLLLGIFFIINLKVLHQNFRKFFTSRK